MARLRSKAIAARRSMNVEERDVASSSIAEKVIRSHEFIAAKTIACYLPMRDEVDTSRIIARAWRAKKRVFTPIVRKHGKMTFCELGPDTLLQRNQFGIWEPVSGQEVAARDLDLVITPLVAFDEKNDRIGMGGGYYDRCFAFLKHRRRWLRPKLLGVAFDCQKVEKIAPNPWDIRLYGVISESSID